jgi:16S rRNA G1207 methylase RsmC
MDIAWNEELIRQAKEVMVKGGELRFVVIKRGSERIPEIYTYPENKVRCSTEYLTE